MYGLIPSAAFGTSLNAENEGNRSNPSNPKNQTHTKPQIDEVVCHTLEGDTLKDALNFIDNIRASKMKFEWSAINVWSVHRGFKHIMDVKVANGTWNITLLLDHAKSENLYSGAEMEGVRKLVNSLRSPVGVPSTTQYART
ncbi:MAG: hypothetical protein FWC13_09465 [Oscillospiraceae bacterium]|nr:hypothetical protein [Oscillospiraceae bacterium]